MRRRPAQISAPGPGCSRNLGFNPRRRERLVHCRGAGAKPRTDEDWRGYCTMAAVTSTKPRVLSPFDASGVFMAPKISAVFTQTGGYL